MQVSDKYLRQVIRSRLLQERPQSERGSAGGGSGRSGGVLSYPDDPSKYKVVDDAWHFQKGGRGEFRPINADRYKKNIFNLDKEHPRERTRDAIIANAAAYLRVEADDVPEHSRVSGWLPAAADDSEDAQEAGDEAAEEAAEATEDAMSVFGRASTRSPTVDLRSIDFDNWNEPGRFDDEGPSPSDLEKQYWQDNAPNFTSLYSVLRDLWENISDYRIWPGKVPGSDSTQADRIERDYERWYEEFGNRLDQIQAEIDEDSKYPRPWEITDRIFDALGVIETAGGTGTDWSLAAYKDVAGYDKEEGPMLDELVAFAKSWSPPEDPGEDLEESIMRKIGSPFNVRPRRERRSVRILREAIRDELREPEILNEMWGQIASAIGGQFGKLAAPVQGAIITTLISSLVGIVGDVFGEKEQVELNQEIQKNPRMADAAALYAAMKKRFGTDEVTVRTVIAKNAHDLPGLADLYTRAAALITGGNIGSTELISDLTSEGMEEEAQQILDAISDKQSSQTETPAAGQQATQMPQMPQVPQVPQVPQTSQTASMMGQADQLRQSMNESRVRKLIRQELLKIL